MRLRSSSHGAYVAGCDQERTGYVLWVHGVLQEHAARWLQMGWANVVRVQSGSTDSPKFTDCARNACQRIAGCEFGEEGGKGRLGLDLLPEGGRTRPNWSGLCVEWICGVVSFLVSRWPFSSRFSKGARPRGLCSRSRRIGHLQADKLPSLREMQSPSYFFFNVFLYSTHWPGITTFSPVESS